MLGVQHGETLLGGCEDMRDTLMVHLSNGVCASNRHQGSILCSQVMVCYMPAAQCFSIENLWALWFSVLNEVQGHIRLHPL